MKPFDQHLFVIFGGTGDLARRKLFPALFEMITDVGSADRCTVLGVGRSNLDDTGYRALTREALTSAGLDADDVDRWCAGHVHYEPFAGDRSDYGSLRQRIEDLEAQHGLTGNRVLYLALPPHAVSSVVESIGRAGFNQGPGWTRLVVEKPFGTDLASSIELNRLVHRHFDEAQVYRIDHYLGKETVQNLLAFRFSNPMFETLWHRDRVESVEITVAEKVGIEGRASYYESAGVLRDMVQNHLTQVLALVAMEAPISFDAERIRNEKVKVIEAIAPIREENVVFGRYGPGTIDGEAVPGYCDEVGVPAGSEAATFVGIKLEVDTWRWQGVPFLLRTGKRLPRRTTEVAVTFVRPPLCIFHGHRDQCPIHPNVLLITLQPDEGFALRFNVKAPSEAMQLDAQALRFSHDDVYGTLPDAYQTLILDIIEGDQTLFVRGDEVEASWRLYEPLLGLRPKLHPYAAGTWGPASSDAKLALGNGPWIPG